MKRLSILTLSVIALSSFIVISSQAQRPHFLKYSASGVNSNGGLNEIPPFPIHTPRNSL